MLVLDLTDSRHYYCIVANSIQCCMVACAIAVLLPVPLFCRTVLCRTSACPRRNTRLHRAPPLYHAALITCFTEHVPCCICWINLHHRRWFLYHYNLLHQLSCTMLSSTWRCHCFALVEPLVCHHCRRRVHAGAREGVASVHERHP